MQVLSAKIAERKRKKVERISNLQKLELDKLLSQQKSAREELESQQVKDMEYYSLYVHVLNGEKHLKSFCHSSKMLK